MKEIKSLCVFCGSNSGHNDVYREKAVALGRLLAEQGVRLVYGGGIVGLMGAVSQAVLDSRGEVTGVIPEHLLGFEVGRTDLTDLRVVGSMHERKALMASLSDGFIAMPGGFGTFEEVLEVMTWSQLGLHEKPIGFLNVDGFYDPLLELFERSVVQGFVRRQNLGLFIVDSDPAGLLAQMRNWAPVPVKKWLVGPEDL